MRDDNRDLEYIALKRYQNGVIKVTSKINPEYDETVDRTRKGIPLIKNARISAERSKNIVLDLARNNDFDYFVTLTFGIHDRLNDSVVKGEWDNWRHEFRRKFSDAYYIAVPEYHEKGGLHVHMVMGNITDKDLQLTDSGKVSCSWCSKGCCSREYYYRTKSCHKKSMKYTDGITIYNVNAWKLGYSTATVVQSKEAVENYIAKYINKGNVDPRFYNAKRYWVSKNIPRPETCKDVIPYGYDVGSSIINDYGAIEHYENPDKAYQSAIMPYLDNTSKLRDILEMSKKSQCRVEPNELFVKHKFCEIDVVI